MYSRSPQYLEQSHRLPVAFSARFRRTRTSAARCLFAACLCLALSAYSLSRASTQILYATGFESTGTPSWNTGAVVGQNGFSGVDVSSPVGNANSTYASSAFQVDSSPITTFTGPGGSETIPVSGSGSAQIVAESTTYTGVPRVTYSNFASVSMQAAWDARNPVNDAVDITFQAFVPSVDSTLLGTNGVAFLGGPTGATTLTTVSLNNDIGGDLDLVLKPENGATITITNIQRPTLLVRDTWITVSAYLDYANGSDTVQVNGTTVILKSANSFDPTQDFYSAALYNQSATADAASAYTFVDNLKVIATAPAPDALPIFSFGLATVPWLCARKRNRVKL